MRKTVSAAMAVVVLAIWVALFANSYAHFERKVANDANRWQISWADRR